MINKKIMPVEKTKRTVLGIFGKFVADLFDMSFYSVVCRGRALEKLALPRQTANDCPNGQAAFSGLKATKLDQLY
jgi:hypothetical protein